MIQDTIAPLGIIAIDQAGTSTGTWDVAHVHSTANSAKLPHKSGSWTVGSFQFGNITGLTATVAITIDGVTKNPLMVTDTGTAIAAGGTITAADGMESFFYMPVGATKIVITATAGSGNVELVLHNDPSVLAAARLKELIASGIPTSTATDSTLWSVTHVPAENTVATINKAAPGANTRLVITGFDALITTTETAPTAAYRLVTITQDPGGTPVVLWNGYIGAPATAGATSGITRVCEIPVATNKSVTIAFASAAGTDTQETVNMNGRVENV